MKTRFSFLLILLGLFLLTHAAFSATWTNNNSNNTFSFTGTTVSTSRYLAGRGTPVYQVTGSADISGTADPFEEINSEYRAEMWLMVSGDLNTSPFPGKGKIDKQKITNGVNYDTFTSGSANIVYKSHPVSKSYKNQGNPLSGVKSRSLSHSTSASYVDTDPTSPSGLSASPEVYGSLSGTMMNHVGSKSVKPLSFQSESNTATGANPDDGSGNVAAEKCFRKQNCKLPLTATGAYSHRVKCPEEIHVLAGEFYKVKRYKKQACPSYWWTCDDDPSDPNTVNKCLRATLHVKPGERSWQWKYVSPDGSVSQYPPTLPCGHSVTASGNHQSVNYACGSHSYYACQTPSTSSHSLQASCSSTKNGSACTVTSFYACQSHTHVYPAPPPPPPPTDNTPNCSGCTSHCSSPCSCTNSGTCNGTVAAPPPPEPEPTLVACERGRGCAVRSSDGRECYVESCASGCGSGYWSCNASAVSWHVTSHPCTRSGCDASYTNCSRGNGTCRAPHPKGGTYQWHGN